MEIKKENNFNSTANMSEQLRKKKSRTATQNNQKEPHGYRI